MTMYQPFQATRLTKFGFDIQKNREISIKTKKRVLTAMSIYLYHSYYMAINTGNFPHK